MSDEPRPDVPEAGDSGVQRALGERRRRRLAERAGQVDLDATMSHWPVTDPPTTPRPVVRPARPTVEGAATAPVLPPPGQTVVGPLLEARRAGVAGESSTSPAGGRRSRRRAAATPPGGPAADGSPRAAESAVEPGWPSGMTGSDAPVARSGARTVTPAPTPTPVSSAPLDRRGTKVLGGRSAARGWLSWPPGRRELAVVVAAVAAVLLVVVLLVTLLGGEEAGEALQPSDGAPAQQTLAVGLAGADGAVGAAALLGVDSARVSTLLLPGDLLLTVADAGERTIEQAAVLGPEAVRRGLEDTLVLRVDTLALLQPQQLAAMVDSAGGVVVDVATQVVTDDVVVPAGDDQRLTGAQAVAYAGLQVDGEPAESGLARFGDVLTALLTVLPAEEAGAAESLAAAEVTATGDTAALPTVLAAAATRAAAGDTQAVVLPTSELTAGGADRRGLAEGEAADVLSTRFAGAQLPVAAVGEVRVVVRNGVGSSGLVGRARDLLVAAGLRYSGGGNAASFGQEETLVLVASQEETDRAQGEAVARALELDGDALEVNSETMVDTDVVVVLGQDFTAGTPDDPSSQIPPTPGDVP